MDNNYLNHILQRIAIHDDQKAFSEFFDHYHSKLIKFALLYVPNYVQAEEIVSEVLINLLKKRKTLHKIEKFEGYLFTMIKNQSLNYIKQNKKNLSHLSIENSEDFFSTERIDPYEKYLELELRDLLNKTIEKLPPKRQMVFKLIKDEGMSQKEVAELMDISVRTVEVHLKLAVKDVRKIIKDYFVESQKEKPLISRRDLNSGLITLLFF